MQGSFNAYTAFVKPTIPSVLDNIRALSDNMTVAMGLRRLQGMLEGEDGPRHLSELAALSPTLKELWAIWDRQVSGSDNDVSSALLGALAAILEHPRATARDSIGALADAAALEVLSRRLKALMFHVGSGDRARTNNALVLLRAIALRSPAHARRLARAVEWKHAALARAAKNSLAKDSQAGDVEAAFTGKDRAQRLPRANLLLLILTLLRTLDAATLETLVAPGHVLALVLDHAASDPRGILLDVVTVLRATVLENALLPAWCKGAVFSDRSLQQLALAAGTFAPTEARERDAAAQMDEDEDGDAEGGDTSVSEACRALVVEALSNPRYGIAPISDRHVVSALQPAGCPHYCSMGGVGPLRLLVANEGPVEAAAGASAARAGPSLRGYLEAAAESTGEEGATSASGPRRVLRVLEKLQPLAFPLHAEIIRSVLRTSPSLALAYLQALPFPLDHGANDPEKTLAAASFAAEVLDLANAAPSLTWAEYVTLSRTEEGVVLEVDLKAALTRLVPAPLTRPLLTRLLLSKAHEARAAALALLDAVLRAAARALRLLIDAAAERLALGARDQPQLAAVDANRLFRAVAAHLEQRLRSRLPDVQAVISCCAAAVEQSQPASDAVEDLLLISATAQREAELALLALAGYCALLPAAAADAHFDPVRLMPSVVRLPAAGRAAGATLASSHAAAGSQGVAAGMSQQGLAALLQLAYADERAAAAAVARVVGSGTFDVCSAAPQHPRGAEAWLWMEALVQVGGCAAAPAFLASFAAEVAVQTLKRPQELFGFVQQARQASADGGMGFSLFALAALRQCLKICAAKSVAADAKFSAATYVALALRLLRATQPAGSLLDGSLLQVIRAEQPTNADVAAAAAAAPPSAKKAKKGEPSPEDAALPAPLAALIEDLRAGGETPAEKAYSAETAVFAALRPSMDESLRRCIAAAATGTVPSVAVLDTVAPTEILEAALARRAASGNGASVRPSWVLLAATGAAAQVTDPSLAVRLVGASARNLCALSSLALPRELAGHRTAAAAHLLAGMASAVQHPWKCALLIAAARAASKDSVPAAAALVMHAALVAPAARAPPSTAAAAPSSSKKRKGAPEGASASPTASAALKEALQVEALACADAAATTLQATPSHSESGVLGRALRDRISSLLDAPGAHSEIDLRTLAKILPAVPLGGAAAAGLPSRVVDAALALVRQGVLDGPHVAFIAAALSACGPFEPRVGALATALLEALAGMKAENAGRVLIGSEALLLRALRTEPAIAAPCATHAPVLVEACLRGATATVAPSPTPLGLGNGASLLIQHLVERDTGARAALVASCGATLTQLREMDRAIYRSSLALLLPAVATSIGSEAATLGPIFSEPLAAYFSARPSLAARAQLPAEAAARMNEHGPRVLVRMLPSVPAALDLLERLCAPELWAALTPETQSCTASERIAAITEVVAFLQNDTDARVIECLLEAASALAGNKAFADGGGKNSAFVAALTGLVTAALPRLPASASVAAEGLSDTLLSLTRSILKRHVTAVPIMADLDALWEALLALAAGSLPVVREATAPAPASTPAAGTKSQQRQKKSSKKDDDDTSSSDSDSSDSSDSDSDSSDDDDEDCSGKKRSPNAALRTALSNLSTDIVPLIPSHSQFAPLLAAARSAAPSHPVQLQLAACVQLLARLAQASKRAAVNALVPSLLPVLTLLHNATTSPLDRAIRSALAALQPFAAIGSGYAFGPFAAALAEAFPKTGLEELSPAQRKEVFARAAPVSVPLLQGSASSSPSSSTSSWFMKEGHPVKQYAYDVPWVTRFLSSVLAEDSLPVASIVSSGMLAVLLRALGWPDPEIRSLASEACRKIIADFSAGYVTKQATQGWGVHARKAGAAKGKDGKRKVKDTRPAIFLLFDFVSRAAGVLKGKDESIAPARLPNAVAVFLAHAALSLVFGDDCPLFGPARPLLPRKALERYLRRKQELDPTDVPMFYVLISGGSKDQKTDRAAASRLLAAALQDASDLEPVRRRYALELLTCLVGSPTLCQPGPALAGLSAILDVVRRVPSVVSDLAGRTGLVAWIGTQIVSLLDVHVAARRGPADSTASALAARAVQCLGGIAEGSGAGRFPRGLLPSLGHVRVALEGRVRGRLRSEVPGAVWKAVEELEGRLQAAAAGGGPDGAVGPASRGAAAV